MRNDAIAHDTGAPFTEPPPPVTLPPMKNKNKIQLITRLINTCAVTRPAKVVVVRLMVLRDKSTGRTPSVLIISNRGPTITAGQNGRTQVEICRPSDARHPSKVRRNRYRQFRQTDGSIQKKKKNRVENGKTDSIKKSFQF